LFFRYKNILISFFSLFLGTLNYCVFREDTLIAHFCRPIEFKLLHINNELLILFFRNYFSDLCWCVFVCENVLFFLKNEIPFGYTVVLIILPVFSEVLQCCNPAIGTFDFYDILLYLLVESLYLCHQRKKIWENIQRIF
jgi:hypothetical protein